MLNKLTRQKSDQLILFSPVLQEQYAELVCVSVIFSNYLLMARCHNDLFAV